MKSKELFMVEHLNGLLSHLSKLTSSYCGVLYYRVSWLKNDITDAFETPYQMKLLHKIRLCIALIDNKFDASEYITFPLGNFLGAKEIQIIKEKIAEVVINHPLTKEEILNYEIRTFANMEDVSEVDECLEDIRKILLAIDA